MHPAALCIQCRVFVSTAQPKSSGGRGPVKAKFKGEVELSDLNPPHACRISGKGTGGLAGFAQGGAAIQLSEHEEGTLLVYDVDAHVGGKLAQLGARLIDSTAKKLALEFFDQLQEQITEKA